MVDTVRIALVLAGAVAAFMLGRLGAKCVPRGKGAFGPPKTIAGVLPELKAAQVWYILSAVLLLVQISGFGTTSY